MGVVYLIMEIKNPVGFPFRCGVHPTTSDTSPWRTNPDSSNDLLMRSSKNLYVCLIPLLGKETGGHGPRSDGYIR